LAFPARKPVGAHRWGRRRGGGMDQMNHFMARARQSSQKSQRSADLMRHIEREDLGKAQVRAHRGARRKSIVRRHSSTTTTRTKVVSRTGRLGMFRHPTCGIAQWNLVASTLPKKPCSTHVLIEAHTTNGNDIQSARRRPPYVVVEPSETLHDIQNPRRIFVPTL
jgi:hypothetical protein